jgi:hypothetical protein
MTAVRSPGHEFFTDDSAPAWRRYGVAIVSVLLSWGLTLAIPPLRAVAIPVYQFSCVPLRNSRGEVIGLTGVGTDISERKRLRIRLLAVFVGIVFAAVSGFAREIALRLKMRQLKKRIVELSGPVNRIARVDRGPAHHALPKA